MQRVLVLLSACLVLAAAAKAKDCEVVARYPDGPEVERECIVEGSARDRPK